MQELWRLHAAGKLEGPQSLLLQTQRPVEELYDTEADPFEIHNLAAEPQFDAELSRLREALDEWRRAVGDLGEVPEAEMVRQWYPDGEQPKTARPVFVPIAEESMGREVSEVGRRFASPCLLGLHCATLGASIGYRLGDDDRARWQLYTGPLSLPEGRTVVTAKAIRIGYRESEERVGTFEIGSSCASPCEDNMLESPGNP